MRMRKKKNLDRRLDVCAHLLIPEPGALRGHWREALMPGAENLLLELGCGKGRFMAAQSADHPKNLYVALERVPEALVMAMEKLRDREGANVFFLREDAALIGSFFGSGEVSGVYVNFCDPWPSNRHAKRRLTHPSFLALYREALAPGGRVEFKTDNAELFEYSADVIPRCGFKLEYITRDLHATGGDGYMTEYEARFSTQGVKIKKLVAVRAD